MAVRRRSLYHLLEDQPFDNPFRSHLKVYIGSLVAVKILIHRRIISGSLEWSGVDRLDIVHGNILLRLPNQLALHVV